MQTFWKKTCRELYRWMNESKMQEHIIYVLEFKRISDAGQEYVTETQQLAEAQHLAVTQDLQKLFKDT